MASATQRYPPESLQAFAAGVFRAMGADTDIAAEVAAHLIRSNLSGYDSHGVIRMSQYVRDADCGELRPAARPTMVSETEATAVVDAHRGFGQYSTRFALDWAVARARQHGLADVAIRHSTHKTDGAGTAAFRRRGRAELAVAVVRQFGP